MSLVGHQAAFLPMWNNPTDHIFSSCNAFDLNSIVKNAGPLSSTLTQSVGASALIPTLARRTWRRGRPPPAARLARWRPPIGNSAFQGRKCNLARPLQSSPPLHAPPLCSFSSLSNQRVQRGFGRLGFFFSTVFR